MPGLTARAGADALLQSPSAASLRSRGIVLLKGSMEVLLLALVVASPWAYGCVHPGFEFLLDVGVALLLLLWGLRMLLEGQLTWKKSSVAVCLAGLFLVGIWQTTPLSRHLLSSLSPTTARLYDQLLPREPETLPLGDERAVVNPAQALTLSFYPEATRKESLRLLAVLLVFAVVLNNLGSEAALRRLSVLALCNGALLSLFALVQFFSSSPGMLYWRYPAASARVFGPFINKNHFACYVNLCIGLGVGLLLSRPASGLRNRRSRRSLSPVDPPSWRSGALSFLGLLHDPLALWVCAALVLMVASVTFSLSRGGFLALLAGAVVCFLLQLRFGRSLRVGAGLVIGVGAFLLVSWFGFGLVESRLQTLWGIEAAQGRLPVWSRALHVARDFPAWGTGYGTFGYVETMYRSDDSEEVFYDHAHNDYLEMLAEGGTVGLLLALLAIGVTAFRGYRAVVLHRGQPAAGLALGALFGLTTLVAHSFTDFGNHIPAIALLATVLCASLCALGRPRQEPGRQETEAGVSAPDPAEYRLRLGGVAPVLGAAVALTLGLLLVGAGWKSHLVEQWKWAANRTGEGDDLDQLRQRVACLSRAASLAPDNATLLHDLGLACLKLHDAERVAATRRNLVARAAGLVAAPAALVPGVSPISGWSLLLAPRTGPSQAEQESLILGLRSLVQARDACPLLANVQLALAGQARNLKKGDAYSAYLQRVKLLACANPEAWYQCGLLELSQRDRQAGLASWRRSLKLSDRFAPLVLGFTARRLSPTDLAEGLLPDRADLLVNTAFRLYPNPEDEEQRRPFLEKAVRVLGEQTDLTGTDLHVKALALKSLGRLDEAVAAYRELLAGQPEEVGSRYELAETLHDKGRLEEAGRELVLVLGRQPDHARARKLLARVGHEMARKK